MYLIDETLTDRTTPNQSEHESNSKERRLFLMGGSYSSEADAIGVFLASSTGLDILLT